MSELHPKLRSAIAYAKDASYTEMSAPENATLAGMATEAQRAIEAQALRDAAELALEKRDAIARTNNGTANRRMALEWFAETLRTRATRIERGEKP